MNGPSVTVTLPFLRETVVAVLGPCSSWPPTIFPDFEYFSNHCPDFSWSAIVCSRAAPSSWFAPSIVPPNNRTYFMAYLLPSTTKSAIRNRLRAGDLRLLLAQKRHDADRGVHAQGRAGEVFGLDVQRVVQAEVLAPPNRVLDHRDRKRRRLGEPAGELLHRGLELIGGHGAVDPARGLGLFRRQSRRQDEVRKGTRLADQARQALGASGAGDDAQRRLGLADLGAPVLDHDPKVAAKRQLAAAAERVAVDGRDHRLRTPLDGHEVVVHPAHEQRDLVGGVRRLD